MEHTVLSDEALADLVKHLPMLLQATMLNKQAFNMAVEVGYIRLSADGKHMEWMLGSKVLLCYFCAKLWCGDKGVYSRRKNAMLWKEGKSVWPVAELSRVFNFPLLKQTRYKKKNTVLPELSELIDNLFISRK